jgi:sulfonate dioxygenase
MSSEPLYPAYLPTRSDGYNAPVAVPLFEAAEPGLRADPAKANLLKGATTANITPRIGTEVRGVQISGLGKEGLDELALLAAERGVVVFVSLIDMRGLMDVLILG